MKDILDQMEIALAELQIRIDAEKAATGTVTSETAFKWWTIATTLRDMRETNSQRPTMH